MKSRSFLKNLLNSIKLLLLVNQIIFITGGQYKFFVGRFLCLENFDVCKFSETIMNSFSETMYSLSKMMFIIFVIYEIMACFWYLLTIVRAIVKMAFAVLLVASVLAFILAFVSPNYAKNIETYLIDLLKSIAVYFVSPNQISNKIHERITS